MAKLYKSKGNYAPILRACFYHEDLRRKLNGGFTIGLEFGKGFNWIWRL